MNNEISTEIISAKILLIRNKKVMIDKDLAGLYGVNTKQLNQQVKRNVDRFPENFMFQLTQDEKNEVVTNCDHLKTLKFSPVLPYAFTEYGAVMLAGVLNSKRAIDVNIQIVKIFTQMREMIFTQKDILLKLQQLEGRIGKNDEEIQLIFNYLKHLVNPPQPPRRKIGFIQDDK